MIDFDVLPDWVFILLWGLSLAAVSYWHKQTLKRTQEGFPDLITLARADTTVLEYNSAYQKLLGDWRGKRWIDSVPASEQALVREKLAQLTPDQPTVVCVNSLPDANGETRWFEWINQGLFDRRGRLQFIRGVGREITQQKQLEETLRMREAQLRTLLDALPLAVWARDSRGVLILQNATDRAWFGDLLGTSIEQAYEQNNWQDSHDKILAQINQQGVYQRESKELILGEERYTYRLTVPIRDQSEGLGVLGITLDMTEQKRLEQELKEQEARFHALIENSHDILHHMDAEGRLYCLNPKAAESILGYVPVPGEFRPLDWVHPQDQDKIAAAFEQLLAHPGQPLSFVYRMQHADGHWVWLESLATNWLADPVIQGIVSNTRDISRQKQVELDLQESERRLKAILDGIPFPIFLKDLQGRYTQVNATYLRLEKLSPDEILGKTDAELFLPDNALRYQREDQTALQSHQPISYEQVVPYPEQEITSLVTKFALRDGNGDPYALCGICVDITPLKTAQDVLLQEAERERLLGSLLQRSRQTLDLDQILQTTV
ncbi:MAG: PAS domain S-box protein, partial [Cyanobacteriota bacterium]